MGIYETVIPAMGIGLCAIALVQLALWSAHSFGGLTLNRKQFRDQSQRFRQQLKSTRTRTDDTDKFSWHGFRHFRVSQLVRETKNCTSVYLVPEDGKPIASFKPGQHLTFRFQIPGQIKPVVRCYSLSDGPGKPHYRISVKEMAPPADRPELQPGRASHYINHQLQVGDRIEVKAPAGSFVLNVQSEKPVVLLAGGIGITPLVSMIEYLIQQQSNRLILLAYGVNHSDDHVFKEQLAKISIQQANVHLLTCYSFPNPEDQQGVDFHVAGFVSVDLLRPVLPNNDCEFYLCGPPPFMNSIFTGLIEWGVEESKIRFEAFGPASIGKASKLEQAPVVTETVSVKFANADVIASWDGSSESLLELAELNQIEIDSGCRAGSCGTCSTELISGRIKYPENQKVNCEAGRCLVCIARPDGPVELGA